VHAERRAEHLLRVARARDVKLERCRAAGLGRRETRGIPAHAREQVVARSGASQRRAELSVGIQLRDADPKRHRFAVRACQEPCADQAIAIAERRVLAAPGKPCRRQRRLGRARGQHQGRNN
jgi:hypothetical protein